jgi:hypothetical protein
MIFDELGGFLSQLPPGLLAYPCLLFFAFMAAGIYFGVVRPRRRKAQKASDTPPPSVSSAPPSVDALFSSTPEGATKPKGVTDRLKLGQVQPSFEVKLDSGETVTAKTVVTILRDPVDDRLLIHLDGVAYRSINDYPASKRKFTALMKELAANIAESAPPRAGSRGRKAKPAAVTPSPEDDEPASAPPAKRTIPAATSSSDYDLPPLDDLVHGPKPAAASPQSPPPLEPAVKAALESDKAPADQDAPGALPDYKALGASDKVVKTGGILRRNKLELTPLPELNIAAAIEAFLQHRLGATRRFLGRRIHVHSAASGGVRIEVDGTFFESVNDIEDDEVRDFIAATIQEWQDRQ